MPAAIAAGLGLNTSGGRLVTDVMSYLRGKRLLLILDNFEQVTEAAPVVAELLAAAPGLVILVTSRTVLRLSGEYELVCSAARGSPARHAGNLDDYASVRLFMARARAAAPGFELTGRNAQAVAEICRRLDGLPLAIELAAAGSGCCPRVRCWPRLDDRMSVLTAGTARPARAAADPAEHSGLELRPAVRRRAGAVQPAWACSPGLSACPPPRPSAATRQVDPGRTDGHAQLAGGQQPGPAWSRARMSPGSACSRPSGVRPGAPARERRLAGRARPACRLLPGPGQAGRHRAARRRAAGLAQPAGNTARQPQRRAVLADRTRSARSGTGPDLGHLEVLVAARPRRGTGPPRGPDPGPQRRHATAPARPGPERSRLRPLRRRRPGPGPAAAQASLPLYQRRPATGSAWA